MFDTATTRAVPVHEMRMVRANGVDLRTQAFGDPVDQPLLLIMGAVASMRRWPAEFCIRLAESGRYVIRYDIRDTGRSTVFPVGAPYADHATVLLITIVVTAISLMFYALMRGGTAVLLVAGLFGLLGIHEAHHWIEAIGKRAYDPGLLTSFAYVGVGLLITVEVARQMKQRWRSRKPSAATA